MASYRPGHEDMYEVPIDMYEVPIDMYEVPIDKKQTKEKEVRTQWEELEDPQRLELSQKSEHYRKKMEKKQRRKVEEVPQRLELSQKSEHYRKKMEKEQRRKVEEEQRKKVEEVPQRLELSQKSEHYRKKMEKVPQRLELSQKSEHYRKKMEKEQRRKVEEEQRKKVEEDYRKKMEKKQKRKVEEEQKRRVEEEQRRRVEEVPQRLELSQKSEHYRKIMEKKQRRKVEEEFEKITEEGQTMVRRLTTVFGRFKIKKGPKNDNFDMPTRMQYDIAIKEGEEVDKTIRVMIIGCYDQGKTTLARNLLSKSIGIIESTNGIDIYNVSCSVHETKWKESPHADDANYQSIQQRLAQIQIPESKNRTDVEGKCNQEYLTVETKNAQMKDKNTYFDAFKKMKQKQGNSKDTDQYKLSLWDFGGQYIFYATHQLFHSRHAIYLLVFDLTRGLHTPVKDEDFPGGTNHMRSMENYIEFWISSVHSYVGTKDGSKPNIILVGTHLDKLRDKNKADKYFEDVRKLFDGRKMGSHIHHETFAISGTDKNDQEVVRLKKTILEIGMKDRPLLPARWIPLEFELRKRQEESVVKYQDIVQINDNDLEHPIPSKELKSFLKFHHANGTFIYFDEGVLADYVVVNPSFLVNAFKCIITSRKFCRKDKSLRSLWNELESRAILKQELLFEVWKNDKSSQFIKYKDALVAFLKKHGIISAALRFDEESGKNISLDYYIVPSFLKEPDNGEIKQFLENRSHTSVSLVYTFDNEAVVSTVYQRLTGAAVGTWPVVEFQSCRFLFENASVFRINLSYAGKFVRFRNTIELLILHMCKGGKISAVMPDFLRRFAENVFRVEFKKLQNIEDSQEVIPYTISFRCQHSLHKHEGSKKTYGLEMLKECKEKTVCCPDSIVHENIDIDKIVHEWFTYGMIDKKIPDRRLFDRELVELTQAIGSEWELLGNYLGVNRIALQHIKSNNDTIAMMILEMLRRWDQDKMEAATLNELVTAINRLPHESVDIDVVKNVSDGIYHL